MQSNNLNNLNIYDNINWPIFNLIGKNKKVLDIGCRNGSLGAKLIKEKKCVVDGIDHVPEVLVKAKKKGYRNIYQKNLNSEYTWDIVEKYDCIVCADVLEHLITPERLLTLIKSNIEYSGKVYISIPNIGFLLYRIKHLLGYWDYEETGIMDKTHLKFYTLKTVKQLLKNAGYKIKYIIGYSGENPKLFRLHKLAKIRPSMFAIQFIIIASPYES